MNKEKNYINIGGYQFSFCVFASFCFVFSQVFVLCFRGTSFCVFGIFKRHLELLGVSRASRVF